jgi:hypothetical protein
MITRQSAFLLVSNCQSVGCGCQSNFFANFLCTGFKAQPRLQPEAACASFAGQHSPLSPIWRRFAPLRIQRIFVVTASDP